MRRKSIMTTDQASELPNDGETIKSLILRTTSHMSFIYLNRHWPNRLDLLDAAELNQKRLKAYIDKHQAKQHYYKHESYLYRGTDFDYNGEFDTNIEHEYKLYFKTLRLILNKIK